MSACSDVRNWFAEKVRGPFEGWISRAEESCSEARRWVEREVRRPIERRRTREERKCKRKKCKWWCACCNKWFCWLETIIERIVEWIVEVIGEWLVETICRIVVKLIKIVGEILISVGRFLAVGLTCLFTDPRGALDALVDLWYDVVDIFSDIGDLVGDLLGAAAELFDITGRFVTDLGDWFGPLGFLFGFVGGIFDIGRQILDGARRIWDGAVDIVVGILHLDFCAALEGLVNGVGFGVGQVFFGATGILSLGSRGVRDIVDRRHLRDWVQEQLEERFEGDELEALEDRLRMDSVSFGARWPVHPLRCTISSRSTTIDLSAMHKDKTLNLYAIAGYAPFGCSDSPVTRSVWQLVYKGTDSRVALGDIRAFLADGPRGAPEFELIAGDKRVLKDMLLVAERKMHQIAIDLEVRRLDTFELVSQAEMVIADTAVGALTTRLKAERGLNARCDLPGVVVFGYQPQHFGVASSWCADSPPPQPTAATVRSSFMAHLFGTVLAHEMGHCFCLKHAGHHGMENIMFTLDKSEDLTAIKGRTVVDYLLIGGEPHFTRMDGENAWRWMLSEAADCL